MNTIIIIITTKEGERRRISTCSGYSTGPGWKENIMLVIIIMMMVMVILMMIEILMMMIRKKTDKNENLKTQMVLDKAATRHGESVEPALQVATTAMIGN